MQEGDAGQGGGEERTELGRGREDQPHMEVGPAMASTAVSYASP